MGSWGYTTGHYHPRRGDKWSVTEDRRLRRLVHKQIIRELPHGKRTERWWFIAAILGRTILGVQARWCALELVDKYRRADRKKKDRK